MKRIPIDARDDNKSEEDSDKLWNFAIRIVKEAMVPNPGQKVKLYY